MPNVETTMIYFYNKFVALYHKKRLSQIAMIISDVDGVLTDGKINIDDNGIETKSYSVLDGMSIKIAQKAGLIFAIVSASDSSSIKHRFCRLGVSEVIFNTDKKVDAIKSLMKKYSLDNNQLAYIGDDYIDIAPMKFCAVSFSPNNASKEAKKTSLIRLKGSGGSGAVREAINIILKSKGLYSEAIKYYTDIQ